MRSRPPFGRWCCSEQSQPLTAKGVLIRQVRHNCPMMTLRNQGDCVKQAANVLESWFSRF